MSRPHPSTSFYLSLLEFLLTSKRQIIAIGEELGLTSIQVTALMLVDPEHPRPMKSFCRLFHCDASNVTGIIDGLEQKQLVSRQNLPNDRRIKTIRLRAAGKRMQQHIIDRLMRGNDFLFDGLTDNEAKQFINIIHKLAATTKPVP